MKTIFTLFIVPTLVCLLSFNAYAQESRPPRPGAGQEEFRGKAPRSAKERAESRTQEMDKAVTLMKSSTRRYTGYFSKRRMPRTLQWETEVRWALLRQVRKDGLRRAVDHLAPREWADLEQEDLL